MDSIDSELAARIRGDIIHGVYAQDERLTEAQLCETHQVSRTPVRLALRILEREGIIIRGEGRGYRIQNVTIADIRQAVEVRGHLESLAARLMAAAPGKRDFLPAMIEAIESIGELVDRGRLDEASIRRMQAANELFHGSILKGCGNSYVGFACQQISHLPMLSAGSMVFDQAMLETPQQLERGLFRLRLGNAQHKVIHDAIASGDAARAEAMMREHSHTMIDYIETFEKRDGALTVSDLVSYSAAEFITSKQ
ncbi:GntR family transcriptional regulator [Microbulbifer sp. S227A]|uniref:GntR family transcriptional regulator n=1 Tax=Microbulbifer sp. S227A TaxID=3415131 RepID=UPI003C7A303E